MSASAISSARAFLYRHPLFFRALFNLATFNFDYLSQRFQASRYPSAFGGLWTDRDDFHERLATMFTDGDINDVQVAQLEAWHRDGIVKLEGAVDSRPIDAYLKDVESLKLRNPSPLLVTSLSLATPANYTKELLLGSDSPRTVDDYFYLESARQLLFQPCITSFLELVYGRPAVLTQSLNFERGSEQALHQDTAFVRMNSPMKVIGAWIALEDVTPGSGELVYYPGSHHWPDYLFSGCFKHYDEQRDGEEQLQAWYQWIVDEGSRRAPPLQTYCPKKGDVLIWHAGIAHGGAAITDRRATRRSLVGHYCPVGVRPLYHYYKPGFRRCYQWRGHRYTSSYYR